MNSRLHPCKQTWFSAAGAFGFAVGLRGVRLNPDVLDSELFASAGEGFASSKA
jgi:hypothetical protein